MSIEIVIRASPRYRRWGVKFAPPPQSIYETGAYDWACSSSYRSVLPHSSQSLSRSSSMTKGRNIASIEHLSPDKFEMLNDRQKDRPFFSDRLCTF